ncbi:MAG: aminotransferase class I/II-fold pyridoxal phosphate-dependent enzyme [Gemmatimonadetes bacterium]|nr:aminotransferase class I/II-fold pyridoxal phosphate-dependent enzyme [Gemmatimonadota bacterium]
MMTATEPESYGYGRVISGPEVETRKALYGRRLIRERILARGEESVYNLTGLVRAFPLEPGDLPKLTSHLAFYAYFSGRAEELAIRHTGGDEQRHGAVLCNRVTSGMLGVMLALVRRGDSVLSLVARGRSHPCVQQAVELAGGSFQEVQGVEALEQAIGESEWNLVVITPLTPQKYHLPAPEVARAISRAKARGLPVILDDAHMASRSVFYEEPLSLELGDADVTVWSLDKHVPGPRSAAVVAKRELITAIRTQVFQYGLEAQTGHYVACLRGIERYDPERIRRAGDLARQLFRRFRARYGDSVYLAGPGVAISAQDFGELVLARARRAPTTLVREEMSVAACFVMLRDYGIVTIPITGFPGAAPTFRLMMHPDGERLGLEAIEEAAERAIDGVVALLGDADAVRELLLGPE